LLLTFDSPTGKNDYIYQQTYLRSQPSTSHYILPIITAGIFTKKLTWPFHPAAEDGSNLRFYYGRLAGK
jgi:hypothetical protein